MTNKEEKDFSAPRHIRFDRVTAVPQRGDLLLGQIVNVSERIATILVSVILRIIEKNSSRHLTLLKTPAPTHANIFKGDVNFPCINLSDILKVGDLVLGRVKIAWFKPVFISLDTKETGVVSGICSNCGVIIPTPRSFSSNTLTCPGCKASRKTKISELYDPIVWRELHFMNKIHILPSA